MKFSDIQYISGSSFQVHRENVYSCTAVDLGCIDPINIIQYMYFFGMECIDPIHFMIFQYTPGGVKLYILYYWLDRTDSTVGWYIWVPQPAPQTTDSQICRTACALPAGYGKGLGLG